MITATAAAPTTMTATAMAVTTTTTATTTTEIREISLNRINGRLVWSVYIALEWAATLDNPWRGLIAAIHFDNGTHGYAGTLRSIDNNKLFLDAGSVFGCPCCHWQLARDVVSPISIFVVSFFLCHRTTMYMEWKKINQHNKWLL